MNQNELPSEHDPLRERLLQGDAAAFSAYLEREREKLTKYVAGRLGAELRHKLEPTDIVQEVHLDALRAFASVELHDPFGWLCQLVERRIIDAHRHFHNQKRGAGEVPLLAAAGPDGEDKLIHLLVASITSPSQAFSRNRKESAMLAALAELSAEQQTAIRLRYVDGLSSKEVAQKLGKSDGATRVILTRSLALLRERLNGELGEEGS